MMCDWKKKKITISIFVLTPSGHRDSHLGPDSIFKAIRFSGHGFPASHPSFAQSTSHSLHGQP